MDQINQDPTPTQTMALGPANQDLPPLDVGVENASPYSSPQTIENRAQKFKYGLGDLLQKTKDEIYNDLSQGNENSLRETAAAEIDSRKYKSIQNLFTEVAARKQGPLTDEEKAGLTSIVLEMNQKTDPRTVLETSYGKQFIAQLDRTAAGSKGNNVLDQAIMEDPNAVAEIMNRHGSLITKNQILNTALEDAHDRAQSQGWIGWGFDMAKSAIPGYTDYMMRGNLDQVGIFAGLGLGANLREQRTALFRMTPDKMKETIDMVSERLGSHDPSMAVAWLQAMKGQSESEAAFEDIQLPFEVGTTATAAKAARAVGVAVDKSLGKTAVADTQKAAQDMVRASLDPNASKSTIEAASGDLAESAVTRSVGNAVGDLTNINPPARKAIESLSTTYRADIDNIVANPGHLGQDIVNRIVETSNNVYRQMVDAVVNVQKVERLPEVLANETTVRAVVESMKDLYVGLKNTVIDVSKPYSVDVGARNYFVDLYVGQADGTYFKNRQVAQNFLDRTGLAGEIGEGKSAKFTKANVEAAKNEKNIRGAEDIITKNTAKLSDNTLTSADKTKAQEQIDLAREYIQDQQNQLNSWRAAAQTATVEQQGLGYYIKITKPINETSPIIRDALAQTADTKLPDSPISQFFTTWLGKLRTPEEVLSKAERQNRLTATYAPSEYFKILKENSKEIQKLQANRFSKGRKRWEEWQRGLENAQELTDPEATGPNKRGYFFKDPADMEHYWQQWFQRLPDEQEVAAYFEFKRGMEVDRWFRNIAEYRNQSRVGAETVSIVTKDATGAEVKSPEFSGVVRKTLPGASDNILVMGDKIGEEKVLPLERQTTKWKEDIQNDIDRGIYRLIEVYAPELRPLNGFGNISDSRIRFVLAPTSEVNPLKWDQIPRRGGGHIQYDHDYYIKQAKIMRDDAGNITRYWYEGDTTIMAIMQRSVGTEVAKHLDEVRKLIKDKNFTAARDYSNRNLHVDWDEVNRWFTGGKTLDGKYEPARLNLDEEIRVVPRGSKIIDLDNNLRNRYANFKDGMKEGSLSRNNRVDFTEERDGYQLLQADMKGTKYNPLYEITPAKAVDPITTLNRGLERIVKSNFMDDYKTMAVEHWISQAKNYLDAHSVKEIQEAPFYYFNEGKFLKSTPPEIRAQLEASRFHTQQLTGQPSLTDGLLYSASQKLADMAVSVAGPKGQVITPRWALPYLRDPFKFVRSIAFDSKLGLFNIPQFIVQAGNYSNILGIAGYKYAAPGTLGAQLHFWTRLNRNPNIIDHLDTLASKFHLPGSSSWKPGEFKEAWQELNKTGFGQVGSEVAVLDTVGQKVVTTAKDTFLEWGRTPFKAGEENARYGAWYTAFKEWRDKNPLGAISNEDRAAILQRADLLNVNMSRASASAMNKGVWSVTTQFYTYQMRLLELFFGSRLTAKDKARMFITNGLLYGVPMATGLTGIPAADYIRQKAMEEGYVVGDDFLKSMFMQGVPSAIGAVISGQGDPQAGTWFDVGNRFGTKGFEFLGNLTSSDKGYLDIVGGPAYSILKDTIAQSDGFARAMISLARRDGDVFPMTVEDLIDPLKEISSVNTAFRALAVANTGRWISKKEAWLDNASVATGVVNVLTGLKDENVNNIQVFHNALQSQKDYEKIISDRFMQEFRRATLALKENNPELSKKFFTRAQAWLEIGGFREDLYNQLMNRAINDNQSVLERLQWDFYIRKSPDDQTFSRADAFRRTQQIQDKRMGTQN